MSISTPQGGDDDVTDPETVRITRPGAKSAPSGKSSSGKASTSGDKDPAAKDAGAKDSAASKDSAAAGKTGSAKPGAGRTSGGRPTGGGQRPNRPGGAGGGNRRRPPVVVKPARNWTPFWIGGVVVLIALGILAYAVITAVQKGEGWQTKADHISGLVDYRKKDPAITGTNYREHTYSVVKYQTTPPTYGDHNPEWQRCDGDVYNGQISDENAVHSLEHGAVWITYDPSLINADQASYLATTYVNGNNYMLMSQYPGQGAPLSLQAWGFQLKINDGSAQKDITDSRIQSFIDDLRQNTSLEPGIDCSSGEYVTALGTQPHDVEGAPNPSASASQGTASTSPTATAPATPTAPASAQ